MQDVGYHQSGVLHIAGLSSLSTLHLPNSCYHIFLHYTDTYIVGNSETLSPGLEASRDTSINEIIETSEAAEADKDVHLSVC